MVQLSHKTFKWLCIIAMLALNVLTANAQTEKVNTHAGLKGIWVICGDRLPKDFKYRILRQKGREDWQTLTDVTFPKSKAEVQANMLNAQRLAGFDVAALSNERLDAVWQRLNQPIMENSPAELQNNYPLRQASGTMWFDTTADSTVSYSYKVQIIDDKNKILNETIGYQSAYPGKKLAVEILPLSIKSVNNSFVGEFSIVNRDALNSCKILRSYYLRSGFEEIQGEITYLNRDSMSIIQFTDNSVVEKVPYTYVVQPIDAAGNYGNLSPELRAFNVADKTIIPSVINFKTTSVEKDKTIKLSWNLKNSKDLISIDIFKCDVYDGKYVKIASVLPTDTSYLDTYVTPIETYYYSIRLNGVYEQSPTSPRIPGILKASNTNVFPPQNLRLVQDGNLVHLTWQRTESDTRAYYVYRSRPKTNQYEQIGNMIITDSATISYIDTIPNNAEAITYAYAVADQNTSYAISGLTAPVFAYAKSANNLPIPHSLQAKLNLDGSVQIIWANMQRDFQSFGGYKVYRSAKSLASGVEGEEEVISDILDKQMNSFVDKSAKPNMVYYYTVRTVAIDEKNTSSPSLVAGITIQPGMVSNVANVRVLTSDKAVIVKWDNPNNNNIKTIKILRLTEGKTAIEEIANLTSSEQAFSDAKITKGNTYYYQLQIEDKQNRKSEMTEAVGVKIY